jgi:hypothetical protein
MAELIQIICIDNLESNTYDSKPLELNKIYWGEFSKPTHKIKTPIYLVYSTQSEDSIIGAFYAERFITLAEWRDRQIDNILEE